MIESIRFQNFRVLRNCTLPLGPLTVLIGANGSGKSTVFEGLKRIAGISPLQLGPPDLSVGADPHEGISLHVRFQGKDGPVEYEFGCRAGEDGVVRETPEKNRPDPGAAAIRKYLTGFQVREFDPARIAGPTEITSGVQLDVSGGNLAGVLDRLRDENRDDFRKLEVEFARAMPEFDQIVLKVSAPGSKELFVRLRHEAVPIPAKQLSVGQRIALAILALSYVPERQQIVCIEEPDRGIHPRLLREVYDALNRLAFPQEYGMQHSPAQVIVTTHSPFFLDLYRDHPESIVIAERNADGVTFHRLTDREDLAADLQGAPLGDLWYSGVLGGVPAR